MDLDEPLQLPVLTWERNGRRKMEVVGRNKQLLYDLVNDDASTVRRNCTYLFDWISVIPGPSSIASGVVPLDYLLT